MKIAGIYRIIVHRLGKPPKFYIGQSHNLKVREKDHFNRLERRSHYNKGLQRDFLKYGRPAVAFEVILICAPDPDILSLYEQSILNSLERKSTYNVRIECVNSSLGIKQSAEANAKRSIALLGRKRTPEEIAKSATARTGQKRTEEAKARMAAARIGRKLSPDHRRKIGLAQKGRKYGPRSKESCIKMSISARKRRSRESQSLIGPNQG